MHQKFLTGSNEIITLPGFARLVVCVRLDAAHFPFTIREESFYNIYLTNALWLVFEATFSSES